MVQSCAIGKLESNLGFVIALFFGNAIKYKSVDRMLDLFDASRKDIHFLYCQSRPFGVSVRPVCVPYSNPEVAAIGEVSVHYPRVILGRRIAIGSEQVFPGGRSRDFVFKVELFVAGVVSGKYKEFKADIRSRKFEQPAMIQTGAVGRYQSRLR